MSERAPTRHPSTFSAALAGLASSRSRTPRIVGALTYFAGALDIASFASGHVPSWLGGGRIGPSTEPRKTPRVEPPYPILMLSWDA